MVDASARPAQPPETQRRLRRAGARARVSQRARPRMRRYAPMFSRISGTLSSAVARRVVIDVGGLGYEIVLPPCIAEKVPSTARRARHARDLRRPQHRRQQRALYVLRFHQRHRTRVLRGAAQRRVHRAALRGARVFAADVGDRRRDRSRRPRVSEDAARHRPAEGARHRRQAAGQGRAFFLIQDARRRRPRRCPISRRSAGRAAAARVQAHRGRSDDPRDARSRRRRSTMPRALLAEIYRRKAAKECHG